MSGARATRLMVPDSLGGWSSVMVQGIAAIDAWRSGRQVLSLLVAEARRVALAGNAVGEDSRIGSSRSGCRVAKLGRTDRNQEPFTARFTNENYQPCVDLVNPT